MVCPMRLPVLPTLQAIKYMPFMFYTSANRLVPLHLIQEFSKLPISLSQLYSTERESKHLILILLYVSVFLNPRLEILTCLFAL